MKKILSYFSSGLLIIGASIGMYTLVKIYSIKSKLPSGVCPVTDNRPMMYVAITLCCISYILSFFESKTIKKQDEN